MPGAGSEQVAISLVNRGDVKKGLGRDREAIDDWTKVIEMKNPPVVQLAWALYYRGAPIRSPTTGTTPARITTE